MLAVGAAVADDLPTEPGPRRRLADQLDENLVATAIAEHGNNGVGERGDPRACRR
jgi:hypothetical protein